MSAIRVVSAFAAGALVAVVTACTGSTTTTQNPGAGGAAAPASAKPSPAGPVVTITPGDGARGAEPSKGITVTAAGGTLKDVAVRTGGDPVAGTYSADHTSWHSTW